jgi:uncharacterized protein (TIGR03083 family)
MSEIIDRHVANTDALSEEIERFALAEEAVDPTAAVPGCPEWTVTDLVAHMGLIHRWAERLVALRAPERISARAMELDLEPPSPQWLRAGGTRLVATLRDAPGADPMWSWGAEQCVAFWSRRQLHETLVHRMDLELTAGRRPEADPVIAADAVAEFLSNLPRAVYFSPGVAELRGEETSLAFTASDTGSRHVVYLQPDGFALTRDDRPTDGELVAPAVDLLLILYRRYPADHRGATITGDAALVDFWLAHSALE